MTRLAACDLRTGWKILGGLLGLLGLLACNYSTAQTADLILQNGRIYTMDEEKPWAEALAIRGERIVAVGYEDEIENLKLRSSSTRVVDLGGRFVIPGFNDSHVHLGGCVSEATQVPIRNAETFAELSSMVKAFARAHPEKQWIVGSGWSNGYPDFPTDGLSKEILDRIVPNQAVVLSSGITHATWVNSEALKLAGVTGETKDPVGGRIIRGPDGEPTGLLEEAAGLMVRKRIPPLTPEEKLEGVRACLNQFSEVGITRALSLGDSELLPQLAQLEQQGALTSRWDVHRRVYEELTPEDLAAGEKERKEYDSDYLSVTGYKFSLDGIIEVHKAYFPSGYADMPNETGWLRFDLERFRLAVKTADAHDFHIVVHAIGPGAIRIAVDAFEEAANARKAEGKSLDTRHHITHAEVPELQDVPRIATLGIVGSINPVMIAPGDIWEGMGDRFAPHVGKKYMDTSAYPLRSYRDEGIILAFGSDCCTTSPLNPLLGVRKAVVRRSLDGNPSSGFAAEQAITVHDALWAYTMGSAYGISRAKDEGSLAIGKLADLIVLSDNLIEIDPDQIADAKVLMTMVGGNVVYEAPAWSEDKP